MRREDSSKDQAPSSRECSGSSPFSLGSRRRNSRCGIPDKSLKAAEYARTPKASPDLLPHLRTPRSVLECARIPPLSCPSPLKVARNPFDSITLKLQFDYDKRTTPGTGATYSPPRTQLP